MPDKGSARGRLRVERGREPSAQPVDLEAYVAESLIELRDLPPRDLVWRDRMAFFQHDNAAHKVPFAVLEVGQA